MKVKSGEVVTCRGPKFTRGGELVKGEFTEVERPCAPLPVKLRGGPLVVAHPIGDDELWAVIHVPTGYALPGRWKSAKRAVASLPSFLALAHWATFTVEMAAQRPDLYEQTRAVVEANGGM